MAAAGQGEAAGGRAAVVDSVVEVRRPVWVQRRMPGLVPQPRCMLRPARQAGPTSLTPWEFTAAHRDRIPAVRCRTPVRLMARSPDVEVCRQGIPDSVQGAFTMRITPA